MPGVNSDFAWHPVLTGAMSHRRAPRPRTPPCSEFGPSFAGGWKASLSNVKRPAASGDAVGVAAHDGAKHGLRATQSLSVDRPSTTLLPLPLSRALPARGHDAAKIEVVQAHAAAVVQGVLGKRGRPPACRVLFSEGGR